MRSRVSLRRPLEPLPHLIDCLCFGVATKTRAFLCIVGAFAGAYAYSPSALAEVEENTSDEVVKSDYSISTLSDITITNHFIDNVISEDGRKYRAIIDNSGGDTEYVYRDTEMYFSGHTAFYSSKNPSEFDEVLIPDTVWSLDGSAGVHVDRISGGPDSEIYAVFGGRFEITDFWSKAPLGLWGDNNTDGGLDLLIPRPQLQVASCGENDPERSNLDYCGDDDIKADKNSDNITIVRRKKNDPTALSAGSNVVLPSGASSSSPSTPSSITAIAPASANTFLLREDLFLMVPYDGVSMFCASMSCAPIPIDPPATLIDDQTPVVDLTPPGVVPPNSTIVPGDPTPNLGQRPIPEAPTWVMTTIGFCIIVFVFGKKKKKRNNTVSIIDAPEVY